MGRQRHPYISKLPSTKSPSPFLKWAGGKAQLLTQLRALVPHTFRGYIEPFLGGGAMFFHLYNVGRITQGAVLSDLNEELMNCYWVIQDREALCRLMPVLEQHARHVMDQDYYYEVRAWDRRPDFAETHTPVERAARTIFLNHTCYNGLYRLNSKGQFNVPYGKWAKPPALFDEGNLWACHRALQGIELHQESFQACLGWAREGDFVYLDPPYAPLSATSSFTCYSGTTFSEEDQRRVSAVFWELDARGVQVLLTNSDTSLVHELYEGARLRTILARRSINSKGERRGAITEVAAFNYSVAC